MPILEVENLSTHFLSDNNLVKAVDNVSFSLEKGESLGIVGESGSGKSVMALSLLQLIPNPPGKIVSGSVKLQGGAGDYVDLLSLSPRQMRKIRGKRIAMIFQEPMTSLNPLFTIGNQIAEVLSLHEGGSKSEIRNRSIEALKLVGIPAPERRIDDYPHQLSGGMRQRVMIAMALACQPDILIADEPTTALDVTIQAQILELIADLQQKLGMSLILITHDLGVIAEVTTRALVMYQGKFVEDASTKNLFAKPQHHYSKKLLASASLGARSLFEQQNEGKFVQVKDVVKTFPVKGAWFSREKTAVHALNSLSLHIKAGETLGLVGESGCGKSTLARALLGLEQIDSGEIKIDGIDLSKLKKKEMVALRRKMQIVFQDPFASLNPRMTVGEVLAEPLLIHRVGNKADRQARVSELLEMVGLSQEMASRYPHEFSGGQRQRICIARALALTPQLIIADEPVSALDVSLRGEIVDLIISLQKKFGLTYLFISHDLKVVEHVSHRIAVMYLGKMMEVFPADQLKLARHPYTQALISAVPESDPVRRSERIVLQGDVPSPLDPPQACPFHPRCQYAQPNCAVEEPGLTEYRPGFTAACHYINDIAPLNTRAKNLEE